MKRNMAVKVAALSVAVATCSMSLLAASKAEAAKWKMFDRRIGMFVHWGVHSVAGRHSQILWRDCVGVTFESVN